jgi:pimeloyl-ACP methyl ester carboxylesterase
MQAVYVHGFASSGRSAKAAYFSERFSAHGVDLHHPDFNEPDFSTLTVTRMLEQLADELASLPPGPVTLIGSSLGAVVAIYTAARAEERVERLVLLAPAVRFPADAHRVLGRDALERWHASGTLELFHFGERRMRQLNYGFYEDGLRYDVMGVDARQPTLIFQGVRDESVDYRDVERYASARPNATLVLMDDDHLLMASLSRIWSGMAEFLGLA